MELKSQKPKPVAYIVGEQSFGGYLYKALAWPRGNEVPHSVGMAACPLYVMPDPDAQQSLTADDVAAQELKGFYAGICVALQIITNMDNGTIWHELVDAVGPDRIHHYAKVTEPDEWETAGFSKYWKQFSERA